MAEDQVRIMCPSLICRRILAVPQSARGKSVKCRNCGTVVKVPDKPGGGPKPAKKQAGDGKQGQSDAA